MEVTTPSKSSKRAKARGITVAHCLVDGCNSDLSRCREYHRRHKVCEEHSKTPRVTICGREQRFCQQCSRFHSLIEFDEGKRSCRKRLDGHNRRRRKPQLESFIRNHGLLFSSQQDARLLSFSDPDSFNITIGSSSWAGNINADKDLKACPKQTGQDCILNQNSRNEASSYSYKVANQFQFLQSTECVLPEVSTRQLLHDPDCPPANGNCSQRIFSDGLSPLVDSDRALSLLSSGSAVTRDICFDHLVQPAQSSMYHHHQHSQPLTEDNLHFSRLGQFPFLDSKPIVSTTTTESSQVSNSSNLHFQEAFQNGLNELSTSGSQQTVTFMWE